MLMMKIYTTHTHTLSLSLCLSLSLSLSQSWDSLSLSLSQSWDLGQKVHSVVSRHHGPSCTGSAVSHTRSCAFLWEVWPETSYRENLENTRLEAQAVKNPPEMQETRVQSLGPEDTLEKRMATHSNVLAWEIPWTDELDGLQSMGWQRVGHDWAAKRKHSPRRFIDYIWKKLFTAGKVTFT